MKKIIYLPILLFFILSNVTFSQDSNFYIGVSAGYATPGGNSLEDGPEPGIDFGFAHRGYRFSENWGFVANLNSSGHTVEDLDDVAFGMAYIGVGPMYSLEVSDNMVLDVKPQLALNMTGVVTDDSSLSSDDVIFRGSGYVLGTSLVFGTGQGFAFSVNVDYVTGTWKEVEYLGETVDYKDGIGSDDMASQFKLGVGLRYNF